MGEGRPTVDGMSIGGIAANDNKWFVHEVEGWIQDTCLASRESSCTQKIEEAKNGSEWESNHKRCSRLSNTNNAKVSTDLNGKIEHEEEKIEV